MRYFAAKTAVVLAAALSRGLKEVRRRPDRGDISITTIIIWVAAIGGAIAIAGTIAAVVAKYNGKLSGI
ncbi:hypothetical protein HUT19_40980 [Streptomyces sp. NA02950]|uniref:hypothetical protein n=1 Tax=Streptomyces sp. NA02950 TaxID=2742137 RepID=UPI00159015B6|nr:hypothetical protein [Streptomyces sp. NA02950]QKV90408.1 hypothetical protein HUT19_00240 [Streptomyces sp. NA02950]QKV97259.1 hypothetical protein HUT19_40980 [Streptomyces sp. NA02950]